MSDKKQLIAERLKEVEHLINLKKEIKKDWYLNQEEIDELVVLTGVKNAYQIELK